MPRESVIAYRFEIEGAIPFDPKNLDDFNRANGRLREPGRDSRGRAGAESRWGDPRGGRDAFCLGRYYLPIPGIHLQGCLAPIAESGRA
jgi:hypothetical protein